MTESQMDHRPFVEGVLAGCFWRAAHYWIGVWTGAGFPPRVEDGKIFMPKGWPEKFPDGPHLINALRHEIASLILKGNAAVGEDPRLNVPVYQPLYLEYLRNRIDDGVRHSAQARRSASFWAKGNKDHPADPDAAGVALKWAEDNDRKIEMLKREVIEMRKAIP